MDKQIILLGTTPEALVNLINENVKAQLIELKKELLQKEASDELLTRKQTCELLQIDSSTLFHWTNAGKVTCYGIANRRYYKRSEIMNALVRKGGDR